MDRGPEGGTKTSDVAAEPGGADLVDAVMTASRVLVAIAARSLAAAGEVSLPQYRVLVLLAGRGPQRVGDLAAALAVHPSSATRMVERLVRSGLVLRRRGPRDRRSLLVTLSSGGRDLVTEVTRRRRADLADLLAALPPERHQPVVDALHALADAAGETGERDLAVGLDGI